jgi:hypothetical protein
MMMMMMMMMTITMAMTLYRSNQTGMYQSVPYVNGKPVMWYSNWWTSRGLEPPYVYYGGKVKTPTSPTYNVYYENTYSGMEVIRFVIVPKVMTPDEIYKESVTPSVSCTAS